MWYLVIPVLIFLVLAMVSHWFTTAMEIKVFSGKHRHLRLVASVLMSATTGKRTLICKPTRRVVELEAIFRDGSTRVRLPLKTKAQQKNRHELLKKVLAFDASAKLSESSDGEMRIYAYLIGDAVKVGDELYSLMASVFDLDDNRSLEFQLDSYVHDLTIISNEWERFYLKAEQELPLAWTTSKTSDDLKKADAGCLPQLASLFLKPVPVITAFYYFGFETAVGTALVVWAISVTYFFIKDRADILQRFWKPNWWLLPGLAGASLWTGNATYFQLLPTAFCAAMALVAAKTVAAQWQTTKHSNYTIDENMEWWTALISIPTVLLGIVVSEYMRGALSLEAWIWYWAYLRIELMVAMIPSGLLLVFGAVVQKPEIAKP